MRLDSCGIYLSSGQVSKYRAGTLHRWRRIELSRSNARLNSTSTCVADHWQLRRCSKTIRIRII
jgi:hypothetical protein